MPLVIPRAALALFLALQVASSASPAAAVILCLSEDGCATLEFAVPGSVRCDDRHCDDPHAASSDEHSCRDIPLLSAGQNLARGSSVPDQSAPYAAVAPAPAPRLPHAGGDAPPVVTLAPTDPLQRLRSVVLTL